MPIPIEPITNALQLLIGEPLGGCRRAMNMQMFGFGPKIPSTTRDGKDILVDAFVLHIQCDWRFTFRDSILFGSNDRFRPPEERQSAEEFDHKNHPTWLDVTQRRVLAQLRGHAVRVNKAYGTMFGGLRIEFIGETALEVLPCEASNESELWRFFDLRNDDAHFVVQADRILPSRRNE